MQNFDHESSIHGTIGTQERVQVRQDKGANYCIRLIKTVFIILATDKQINRVYLIVH